MKVTQDVKDASAWSERVRSAGLSLGLVPTMGALHDGHFALIERARQECERVAVSVFVNPTQFGASEDLGEYPRAPVEDERACRERGVDLVLFGQTGGDGGMYATDFQTWVKVERISEPLCGKLRPVHFRGVTTIVTILFGVFRPHRAYFGQKDYQQAQVVRRLAEDLRTGVEVRLVPTVREPDGLAMSSRNRYLSEAERQSAVAIPRALFEAEELFRRGENRPSELRARIEERLAAVPDLEVQYVEALDAETLEEVPENRVPEASGLVLAVAARVGRARLIDNLLLGTSP